MMMGRALLSVAALAGFACSFLVDGTVPGFDRVTYFGQHDDRAVATALHLFADEWDFAFGYVPDFSRLEIRETQLADAAGYTPDASHVLLDPRDRLSDTALAHELIHVALWRHEMTPDHDHAAGVGPWTDQHDDLDARVRQAMREVGL